MAEQRAVSAGTVDAPVVAQGKEEPLRASSITAVGRGMRTSRQFADVMAAIIRDVLVGSVTPSVANAAVNAGGKLLKVKELELKYGKGENPVLSLAMNEEQEE